MGSCLCVYICMCMYGLMFKYTGTCVHMYVYVWAHVHYILCVFIRMCVHVYMLTALAPSASAKLRRISFTAELLSSEPIKSLVNSA